MSPTQRKALALFVLLLGGLVGPSVCRTIQGTVEPSFLRVDSAAPSMDGPRFVQRP